MGKIRALVLAGNGINCEYETAKACEFAGFDAVDIVYIYDLVRGNAKMDDYHLFCFPGGFLDGDDLGAAKAAANLFLNSTIEETGEPLKDALSRFVESGKLVIGICNGFQMIAKLGLVPALNGYFSQDATLVFNDSGKFEDRWVRLKVEDSPCIFTRGLSDLYFPVRHGEGKFHAPKATLGEIERRGFVVLRYADKHTGAPTQRYPDNPNGSLNAIAGICDPSGRVFGLMPHPEAFLSRYNHPHWTRQELPDDGQGVMVFKNAYEYLQDRFGCRSARDR